jgi:hypothetical protein
MSPILTPERYAEAYMRKKQNQSDLQRIIKSCVLKSSGTNPVELDDAFTQSLSQNFLVLSAPSLLPYPSLDPHLTLSGLACQKRQESADP